MEKYIFDQNNGLWYELRGDYSHPMKLYKINQRKYVMILSISISHRRPP